MLQTARKNPMLTKSTNQSIINQNYNFSKHCLKVNLPVHVNYQDVITRMILLFKNDTQGGYVNVVFHQIIEQ